MRTKRDLVIVGGGPAGIATALFVQHHAPALAERLLVLEKETYPRDKYCAGAVGGRALKLLEAIGVQVDVPGVPIDAFSFTAADQRWVVRESNLGRVVRRIEFDHELARIALRRGIDVRDGAAVERIEVAPHGARVILSGGECIETRAIVGADGVGGPVRRSAGLSRGRLRAQAIELDTEIVDGDPAPGTLHFDFGAHSLNGYAWDFPTLEGGEAKMCRGVYRILRGDPGDDARAHLERYLTAKGLSIARYRLKPFGQRGFDQGEPISRPRVLLVGEAAGIDIATGEGIAQAIAYGKVAAHYLAHAFHQGDLSFGDWLVHLRRSIVGRELRARHLVYRTLYGPRRPKLERLAARSPHVLRVWMQSFAGKSTGPLAWAKALSNVAPALLEHGPGAVVRVLRQP